MKHIILFLALSCIIALKAQEYKSEVWNGDLGNGYYRNPIIYADYSDPDVCKVNDDYFMTSSSFNCLPGLQILHSKDLVNWKIISAAIPEKLYPYNDSIPQHGKRVWAPCIRYHNNEFYIFWGDPDFGIYMTKSKKIETNWSEPVLIKEGKGLIDPSPLWDENGKLYIVHAYAGSRANINSIIAVCELDTVNFKPKSNSRIVYDGHGVNDVCEGPKFYKRNGYYYILMPAGGVATGWQVALRSKNIYGPYEAKTVMKQGNTKINGPHQGAWIDTNTGEDWFIHFQDVGAAGRIIHLQPMVWKNDWPVIGIDNDNDGCGTPVTKFKKPNVKVTQKIIFTPQESDEFNNEKIGLQWQWHGNIDEKWFFCDKQNGKLRLYAKSLNPDDNNLWNTSSLLLQKIPAPNFKATTHLSFKPNNINKNERCGLIIMGLDYSSIEIINTNNGIFLQQIICNNAEKNNNETIAERILLTNSDNLFLRAEIFSTGKNIKESVQGLYKEMMCKFHYSTDGKIFKPLGKSFRLKEGKWIGSKIGLYCVRPYIKSDKLGWVDFDYFHITK